ncbi:CD1375 family protein [Paenibacillus sp. IHB B 3415]|nr:CD1375 family protein [Paenibacillus sp. IHB B 3415]
MAKVYASLIRKSLKTLEQVPENLRADVATLLEAE